MTKINKEREIIKWPKNLKQLLIQQLGYSINYKHESGEYNENVNRIISVRNKERYKSDNYQKESQTTLK